LPVEFIFHPNVAAYEIMAQNNTKYESLQGQLKD
jgi:hypothetical protein